MSQPYPTAVGLVLRRAQAEPWENRRRFLEGASPAPMRSSCFAPRVGEPNWSSSIRVIIEGDWKSKMKKNL